MNNVYTNGMNLNLNEVAHLEFLMTIQGGGSIPVARVSMLYDVLKQLHKSMGEAIEQHDAKLHQLQRAKENMN